MAAWLRSIPALVGHDESGVDQDGFVWGRKFYGRPNPFWVEKDGRERVRCNCGEDRFRLAYGDYEIRAVCAACGIESVVYDG